MGAIRYCVMRAADVNARAFSGLNINDGRREEVL